jgi:hypothetical protein
VIGTALNWSRYEDRGRDLPRWLVNACLPRIGTTVPYPMAPLGVREGDKTPSEKARVFAGIVGPAVGALSAHVGIVIPPAAAVVVAGRNAVEGHAHLVPVVVFGDRIASVLRIFDNHLHR